MQFSRIPSLGLKIYILLNLILISVFVYSIASYSLLERRGDIQFLISVILISILLF
jgi:hypothetical protein